MAPESDPQAEVAAEAEIIEQPEAEVAVEQQPEAEAEAEAEVVDEPAADAEAEAELEVDEIAELNKSLIPMQHRDGNGACDLYEQDKDGNILVPASEAAQMLEHGFVPAVAE